MLCQHSATVSDMNTSTFISNIIILLLLGVSLNACSIINEASAIPVYDYSTIGKTPDKLRFIAVGDTGKGNSGQYQVAQTMQKKCEKSGCDFILLLGDNIYNSGVTSIDDPQFKRKFELPYKKINVPFFAVLGNHDYGGNGRKYDPEKSIYQIKYSAISDKWHMPHNYYHFTIQNTSFFALDTNILMRKLDKQQKTDITNWIKSTQSKWNIAFGHHPYISNGQHGNAGEYDGVSESSALNGQAINDFTESVLCGKVDLYLSGHDHDRQWLEYKCRGTQFAISGAGSSTRQLSGINPTLYESDEPGILYISIDGNTLTAEFIDVDSEVNFKHTIKK